MILFPLFIILIFNIVLGVYFEPGILEGYLNSNQEELIDNSSEEIIELDEKIKKKTRKKGKKTKTRKKEKSNMI